MFPSFATSVNDTSGKFTAVSLSQWCQLQFATGINATSSIPVAKLTTGVVDTDGKFANGVIDTGISP
jgi:hypothetical protein